jgi:hypothetical protein
VEAFSDEKKLLARSEPEELNFKLNILTYYIMRMKIINMDGLFSCTS